MRDLSNFKVIKPKRRYKMADINEVKLSGKVSYLESKSTSSSNLWKFNLGVNSFRKKKETNETVVNTQYFKCITWNSGIAQKLQNGSNVTITGRLGNNVYEKDGVKQTSTQVVVNDVVVNSAAPTEQIVSPNDNAPTEDGIAF